jgi:hypothetical protein
VNTHMGSLAAISALQWSAGPGEDSMCNPWPFKASIMRSLGTVFLDGFFCLKKTGVLWTVHQYFISAWRPVVSRCSVLS